MPKPTFLFVLLFLWCGCNQNAAQYNTNNRQKATEPLELTADDIVSAFPGNGEKVRQAYMVHGHLLAFLEDSFRLVVINSNGSIVAQKALDPAYPGKRVLVSASFYYNGSQMVFGNYFGKYYFFSIQGNGNWEITHKDVQAGDNGASPYHEYTAGKATLSLYSHESQTPLPEAPAIESDAWATLILQEGDDSEKLLLTHTTFANNSGFAPNRMLDLPIQVRMHHGSATVFNKQKMEVGYWKPGQKKLQPLTQVPSDFTYAPNSSFFGPSAEWLISTRVWIEDTEQQGHYYFVSQQTSAAGERKTYVRQYSAKTKEWKLVGTLTLEAIHEPLQIAGGYLYFYHWMDQVPQIGKVALYTKH